MLATTLKYAGILSVDSIASKVINSEHGFESSIRAVDSSLQRFGFGASMSSPSHVLG